MRVLHVYSGNLYGGVESALATICRTSRSAGGTEHEVALCFDGRLRRELEDMGARVHALGATRVRRPWTLVAARRRLAAVLARFDYDAVICHSAWSHAVFGGVVQRRGVPEVLFLHDRVSGRHWLERWAFLTRPDAVISNSRFTRASVDELLSPPRSHVWYLPVAPVAVTADRAAVRGALGADPGAVVIVQACRLERWKGHVLHLEALAQLTRVAGLCAWECWMIGGPQRAAEREYLDELKVLAQRWGLGTRVRFLGQRSDVPTLLAAADIHCQPNISPEPFGLAYVEALHAGLPVVATRMGGAVELLDETCAFLTAPDASAVASALERLIREPELRQAMGQAGRVRAAARCDPTRQLDTLSTLLRRGALHA